MSDWQPIETVPKMENDGNAEPIYVVICDASTGAMVVAYWAWDNVVNWQPVDAETKKRVVTPFGYWETDGVHIHEPTHWLELPAPPPRANRIEKDME